MNGQGELAVELAASIREQVKGIAGVEVAICPTFLSLESIARAFAGTGIKVGGQDLFWRDSGAYTGKVSGPMLKAAGASLVILGHSECRGRFGKAEADVTTETIKQFGDNDATLVLKVRAALKADLDVILCCGETLPERQAGQTDVIVSAQVEAVLRGLSAADLRRVTIAYEPVWAIGTGQTCDAAEANRVCGVIRGVVARVGGAEAGAGMRIQYGGSVNAENAVEILSQPEIDGALVGGASLKPGAFAQIVRAGR
jgi:triosephosphate isomerase